MMAEATNSTKLSAKAKPGLVVFDLDYTLWPFWVDTHHDRPFSKKGSSVADRHGQKVKFYPDVPEVFEYLSQENIPMAIASRTSETKGANELIDLFGWSKYFVYKEIYPGCKINHFQVFQDKSQTPYKSMLFFDDEHRNIKDLSSKGVNCILVEEGVTMQLVKDALKKFENN